MSRSPAPPSARLLIVDSDRALVAALTALLRAAGHEVDASLDATDIPARLARGRSQVLLADVDAAVIADVRRRSPTVASIVMTPFPTVAGAVAAMRAGAVDYLSKPMSDDAVRDAVARAAGSLASPPDETAAVAGPPGMVGRDAQMLRIFELVNTVADSRTTVLLNGESGTGKSVLARAIHARSSRRDRPFVEVSCGALSETLLESELFGHVRGAFTGAAVDRPGRFLAADGGTLFLDEINSATPALQVKLLRVLQERAFEPVGSTATRTVDVRVVLASNADLAAMVADGRFRQDLYYRVNVIALNVPPLRDRPGDVPLLAEQFLRRFRQDGHRPAAAFSAAAAAAMARYPWPGNVRELENAVERAVVLCPRAEIDVDDLPEAVRSSPAPLASASVPAGAAPAFETALPLVAALELPERRIIESALRRNGWNRQMTADELGINRTTLYKKMLKLQLQGSAPGPV